MQTTISENTVEALKLVKTYAGGRFHIWNLAGNAKASCRAHIMSVLLGVKMPQIKAGMTAMAAALLDAVGAAGDCPAARESDFAAKAQAIIAANSWRSGRCDI
jgi:hypothetical protein